jgi:hypothetical protein
MVENNIPLELADAIIPWEQKLGQTIQETLNVVI